MMHTSRSLPTTKRINIEAYNRLVTEYQDTLYNFAYYVLCDQTAAIRATQQAFIQAFHNLEDYKGESFRIWFLRNLVQVCQSKFRGNLRTARPLELNGKAEIPLESLPSELRMAIVLVELEGLNYQQAAGLTGISPAGIAQQLSEARQQLSSNSLP